MGLILSKPEIPYVRDRVRLCDGLEPLDSPTVAAAGAGRFVFILGGFKLTRQPDDTYSRSIMMDYVDLMLSTRVRFSIGDFFDFGNLSTFYALDERTVVLVDVNETDKTLRQRLVTIDPAKATAHAFLDRGYLLNTRGGRDQGFPQSAVSEDRVITKVPVGNEWLVTIVYPKNPLDLRAPVDDLTDVIHDAANRLRREANTADYEFEISDMNAPFFLSRTKVGFFTKRIDVRARIRAQQQRRAGMRNIVFFRSDPTDTSCVEHSYVVAYDMQADDISIVRIQTDPATNFPCNAEQQPPYQSLSACGASNQLGLLITDRHSARGWQVTAARLFEKVAELMDFISRLIYRLYVRLMNLRSFLTRISRRVKDMRKVRFGRLDVKTMQWREHPGVTDEMKFEKYNKIGLTGFPDGQFLIYDRENQTRSATRVIGCYKRSSGLREDLRVLSNPGICYSLKTLAEMKLRQRPIARLAIMQIAARIQY